MVLSNEKIENLLAKYENAETTLHEERQLSSYFASDDVAPHLEHYKIMFQYFANTQNEVFTKDVPLKPKRRLIYQWISVAAVAIFMLGIVIPKINSGPKTLNQYSEADQKMYLETKKALAMLSSNFNEGAASFNVLGLATDNFNKGISNAGYVSEFGKTTNKFIKQ